MNIDLKSFVEKLLISNNINISSKCDKNKVIKELASYVDALIFNIVSIGCLIALLNNSKKIKNENITIIKNYIESKCKFKYSKNSIKGGCTSLPSDFYGINNNNYTTNAGNDILIVDWSNGIARPAIGSDNSIIKGGCGSKKCKNVIKLYISDVLKYYKIKNSNKDINFKIIHDIVNKNDILKVLK